MLPQDFANKNSISLPVETLKSCCTALRIMRLSKDFLHDREHPLRMIDTLDQNLEEIYRESKKKINFERLLLAICWHDVWRSSRLPKSIPSIIFDQYLGDGPGSARVFNKLESTLPRKLKRSVRGFVFRHSLPTLAKRLVSRGVEEKVFHDLDSLEEWSMDRIRKMEKKFIPIAVKEPVLFNLAHFYFRFIMSKRSEKGYNFKWSKKEFLMRKAEVLREVTRLENLYGQSPVAMRKLLFPRLFRF